MDPTCLAGRRSVFCSEKNNNNNFIENKTFHSAFKPTFELRLVCMVSESIKVTRFWCVLPGDIFQYDTSWKHLSKEKLFTFYLLYERKLLTEFIKPHILGEKVPKGKDRHIDEILILNDLNSWFTM